MLPRMDKAGVTTLLSGLLLLASLAVLTGCGRKNTPPAASAVGPTTAFAGYPVEFSGATSSDLEGDPITFTWSLIERPASSTAALSRADAVRTSLVPDVPGRYTVSLVVKDPESYSPASYWSVEVKPWFSDATKQAGVGGIGISGQYFRLTSDPMAGAAWGDYDGDGYQDLYVAVGQYGWMRDRLYRNNGDGTFTLDAAFSEAMGTAEQRDAARGVLWGDYDSDGHLDLYRVNSGSLTTSFAIPNDLYRNNGDGTFIDAADGAGVSDPRFGMGAAWGDYDGDGRLDLVVANHARIVRGEDGKITWSNEHVALYRNNADGTFTDMAAEAGLASDPIAPRSDWEGAVRCGAPWQPLWVDYDGDGDPDLFITCEAGTGTNLLYRNNGDGTFTDVTEEAGLSGSDGHGVVAADYDNDGDLDLFVTGASSNRLWRNNGDGTFTDVTAAAGVAGPGGVTWGAAFFDYDNDGRQDLFVGAGDWTTYGYAEEREKLGTNRLYRNNGDGTFTEVTEKSGLGLASITRGVALADYDNDGDLDIFITCSDDSDYLYKNEVANSLPNRWLKVRLQGTDGNTNAIGATVKVKAGNLRPTKQLFAGGSFLSMDAPVLHFGLGSARTVDDIEIRWPSGRLQVVRDVATNQTVTITEGG